MEGDAWPFSMRESIERETPERCVSSTHERPAAWRRRLTWVPTSAAASLRVGLALGAGRWSEGRSLKGRAVGKGEATCGVLAIADFGGACGRDWHES